MDRATLLSILKTYGHRRLELEFRLGHRVGTAFVPGVSEDAWTKLKAILDSSPDFEVVITNTRELICDDGSKYVIPEQGTPGWIHKKRLCDFDADTESAWSCRTSASLEEPSNRPAPSKHKFERCKQRWSYVHKCWSVDLTRVTSNMPHQLDNDAMSFEIEIELRDPSELLSRPAEHVLEWGTTMVNDMCKLMSS